MEKSDDRPAIRIRPFELVFEEGLELIFDHITGGVIGAIFRKTMTRAEFAAAFPKLAKEGGNGKE